MPQGAQARVFMNRLLDFMSTLHLTQQAPLPLSAGQDIAWVMTFLKQFNGCTMIRSRVVSVVVCIDACPRGLGGVWWGEQFYRVPLPESIKGLGLPISSIECFNLLVALRLWVSSWKGLTVLIFSDNWAMVCAMQSGRAQESTVTVVDAGGVAPGSIGGCRVGHQTSPWCRHGCGRRSEPGIVFRRGKGGV